jgi:hypothetical protein
VVTRDPIRVTESFSASTDTGDGSTAVRVPQTTNRGDAAAVVTARSDTGNVVIDDLR